jgi:2-polyprenyl-3-methyl-5-hydroxy-6-metoxy-1,4-benzoquinol methylase
MKSDDISKEQSTTDVSYDELVTYWRRLHQNYGLDRNYQDDPGIITLPDVPGWMNRFSSFTQRRAFAKGIRVLGDLRDRRVLDVGCGRGRWSRLLRDNGAHVVGIDVSEDAIRLNQANIPGARFIKQDVLDMDFAAGSFDVAVSVTVLQHVPYDKQSLAMGRLRHVVRSGGHLLLLENIKDRGNHMFAQSIQGWVDLAASVGFERILLAGYAYEPLLVGARYLRGALSRRLATPRGKPSQMQRGRSRKSSFGAAARIAIYWPLVMGSYILEPMCDHLLPPQLATHCVMVFRAA